ncbi:uncharacterized protein C9orf40 homolog [Pteropus alecto]|uniref:Uncharacterized protein C9orf40 homolog n=2 Tax=Pteropus TaxID=9401 RepID=A0A6P3RLZ9_PTEVA|nr:uncharacterized protein C9orf40 homolog [Pteropus alecto]XP_011376202.1 uncharacterized protein C9orf40 homolog [Pteropus vampyrus]XP_039699154.1 uncharacterized protein C9orf40 homolog [Pteropus giganteus]ELK07068.1 hypothetical protein PAL_GLEAN10021099 [Pteropus alecto]
MAKRRAAEPLTFHVPWKRLLLCDFPEEPPPPLWIPPPGASHPGQLLGVPELPRKRRIDSGAMTEPAASPSKRRDGGDISAPGGGECEDRGLETGEPSSLLQPPERPSGPGEESRGALPPRGGGDDGAGRAESPRRDWGAAPLQLNEEFWQYNTFQYWRNPLPPIDLADIEDVNEDNLTEARLQGKNEVVEIDMES